jgi:thiamine pyrophosphokinase
MPKTIIFAGSDISDYEWLRSKTQDADFVICADSGARHAYAIGVTPDIIIGDFDSISPNLLTYYTDKSNIIRDTDQNTTDLMKAERLSSSLDLIEGSLSVARDPLVKPKDDIVIDIYGANGQRADHDFSNYLMLMSMASPDHIAIRTQHDTRRVVKSSYALGGNIGDYVGLFPLAPMVEFKVEGLKYDPSVLGDNYDFGWNGACNEMIADTATIMFSEGVLLITHSKN